MDTTRYRWITTRHRHVLVLVLVAVACGARTVEVDPTGLATSPTPPAVPVATPSPPEVPSTSEAPPPPAVPSVEPAPAHVVEDDEGACPGRLGPSEEYAVGFHDWPGGFDVGQEFACGLILRYSEDPVIAHIIVEVWDKEDFMNRVFEDPNVRYADPNCCAEADES